MGEKVTVYGQSDDLIEIRGAIDEELYLDFFGMKKFRVGEWKLKAEYNGEWDFSYLNLPKNASCKYYSVGEYSEAPDYSATIEFEVEEEDPTIEKL